MSHIFAPQTITALRPTSFAVGDLVHVDGDTPGRAPWRITAIVTDDPQHDGPYALLEDTVNGGPSWSALRILVPTRRPAWAVAQIPSDDTVLHIGAEVVLEVRSPDGGDADRILTSLEQLGNGDPEIRIQGAADQPMTLAQAWRQSLILQDLVMRALGREVTR